MAPSLCLPQQGCQLILTLLLKVIPVVPSPPQGCARAPAACMPHPTSCPASRRCAGSQLHPWDGSWGATFSTAPSACRRSRPNQAGIHWPTLLLGFLARSHPTFHPNVVFQLGEALWHGLAVPVPGLCCIITNCTYGLCRPTPGGCVPGAPWVLSGCQNMPEVGCNSGHSRPWGGRTQAHGEGRPLGITADTGGAGIGHTALSPHAREKHLQHCQHWLWPSQKGLLEAPNFRGSLWRDHPAVIRHQSPWKMKVKVQVGD